tara:strand:+ start:327 stop:542 length:216 start_codon:yes stop_codon:yes gene_type:complete
VVVVVEAKMAVTLELLELVDLVVVEMEQLILAQQEVTEPLILVEAVVVQLSKLVVALQPQPDMVEDLVLLY